MSVDLKYYKNRIKTLTGAEEIHIQVSTLNRDGTYSSKWFEADDYYLGKTEYEGGARIQVCDESNNQIARFNLMQMPACCGICVLTNSAVSYSYQKKGIATLLGQMQKDIAIWNGFTVLLCTDVATNTAQKKVLSRNGWFDLWRFQNKRTNNYVDISVTDLDSNRPGKSLNGEASHPVNNRMIDMTLGGWVSWLLSSLLSMD